MTTPTHYEVLSLPQSLLDGSKDNQIPTIVKQAYHRALLRHHPDKAPQKPTISSTSSTPSSSPCATYTIDQITTAYTTLSRPSLRVEYNARLRTLPSTNPTSSTPSAFQTGIETLDLDDLASEEVTCTTTWFRPCRCGNERGFIFGEADLEEAGDLGELIVGCQGCSLWLRVCFAVVDDDEEEGGAPGECGGKENDRTTHGLK